MVTAARRERRDGDGRTEEVRHLPIGRDTLLEPIRDCFQRFAEPVH
jgi:hypothetical protein